MNNTHTRLPAFEIRSCRGATACPNALGTGLGLRTSLERVCTDSGLQEFISSRCAGPIKRHHQFRIALSCCPNGCTRPQIADIGLLGAGTVLRSGEECSRCSACVQACAEQGVSLTPDGPVIDQERCLCCGQCARACPTGSLELAHTGWRVQLGGRLGRHPRLARELEGIFADREVPEIVQACLEHFITHARPGERLSDLLLRIPIMGVAWKET